MWTVHTFSELHPGINLNATVASFDSEHGAETYAEQHAQDYADGLYVLSPYGVVSTGEGYYRITDGVVCNEDGVPLND